MKHKFNIKFNKNIVFKLAVFLIVLFLIYSFISLFTKIKSKKEEINQTQNQILTEKSKNEEILGMIEKQELNDESRENSFSKDNVRVYESVVK